MAVGGDCNDADPTARTGVEEICDGQDSNCDGEVDEGVKSTFYKDYDQDGTGDRDTTFEACEAPEGYVDNPYDCDDHFADINELAPDICDGKDNDCDGAFDEDPDTVRYRDADGDGHGDPALTTFACDVPAGYAEDALDCDDARAEVSPDAYESCNRVDDDCDGATDEPDAVDAVVFYADGDGDGYGYAGSTTYACSAPSGNSSLPMVVGVDAWLALDASSTYTGNGEDVIEVDGGSSSRAGTVDILDVDYRVTDSVDFNYSTEFEAGVATYVATGELLCFDAVFTASGTATAPVTFTSDQSVPAAGDWGCLDLGSTSDGSSGTYLVVEYGGTATGCNASIDLYFTSLTLSNSTVRYSSKYGIYKGSSTLTASGMTYASNSYGDTN